MNKKGIIFDLDGTLWDSSAQVVPAWNLVLKRYSSEFDKQITQDDMHKFMGRTLENIAEMMFPDMDYEKRINILKECCRGEQEYLRDYGGILYPRLEETLKKLHKNNYYLYIVSNCQNGYVQSFLDYHNLWDFFADIEMSGRTGKCKGENIKMIIQRNGIKKAVYVGDTSGDLEGAEYAKIPFIYASYGFGDLFNMKYSLKEFADISRVIKNII